MDLKDLFNFRTWLKIIFLVIFHLNFMKKPPLILNLNTVLNGLNNLPLKTIKD